MPRLLLLLLLLLAVASLVRLRGERQGKSRASWLPKDWGDALRQIALFALADVCYETVRGVAENNTALAFANARSIVDFEKGLGLFFEPGFQSWAMGHRLLIDIANFAYVNSHFVVTTCVLVWLYLRHNDRFYFVRNMFMVAMVLALVGYMTMPTAPPRFFPELGIVDTIAYYADVHHDSAFVNLFFNPYAAVPSMHVAFALMLGVSCMLLVRRRVFKLLWALYPAFVASVVIVTGNHWWFDGFVGACVALVSALVSAFVLARLRPAAWSWRPGAAQATA